MASAYRYYGMQCLPYEMIEHIVNFMDGRSLIRAKSVCTRWNEVATLFDKKNDHWKNICFEEISRCVLLELTVKKYPFWRPRSKSNEQLNWKDVYLTWLHWRALSNSVYYIDVISDHKSGCITCLKLIGNSIVVGMGNGEIKSWKAGGREPYLVSRHHSRVNCLEVMSILDKRRGDGINQLDYILSTSNDKIVKISYLIDEGMPPNYFDVYHHQHCITMVRAQQSYFTTLDESGTIAVFVVSGPSFDDDMPQITGMTKDGTILSADFFKDGKRMRVESTPENGTVHVTVVQNSSAYANKVNQYKEIEIMQYYHWRGDIFMWITDDHNMLISLNGNEYYEYNIERILNTYPTTALLYGNMLILGLESGAIVMYYVETAEDLVHLNLRAHHWLHDIANDPIITIDILETSAGPVLAVLSHTNVYLIEWSFNIEDVISGVADF
ncbi:uncharacterized protein [Hetaerina americana]|uniref:uncharacterized protein isoform X2 n=1 Tax=Hetaerina americana TaxID=62018 RepID=UPI003A7F4DB6